mmetsp:Transcript_7296/g.15616  ORF Transcript_7296/g.15616 Transcript_7296/m.15616 type:complete len:82 (+) Transcript_7296:37-282(+)
MGATANVNEGGGDGDRWGDVIRLVATAVCVALRNASSGFRPGLERALPCINNCGPFPGGTGELLRIDIVACIGDPSVLEAA